MWRIRTPRVYRYLGQRFVDEFFDSGALRLSSFRQFSAHKDELRLDTNEGKVYYISRTGADGGQTVLMEVDYGHDAYVLCGSMTPTQELMASFACDSAIVICDTTAFAREVAKAVPGFRAGVEGPCSYQYRRIVEKDSGWLDFGTAEETDDISKMKPDAISKMYAEMNSADAYFLKRESHRNQAEYRFIWLTDRDVAGTLDIVVPDARKYCVPWKGQGSVVAF